MQLNKNIETYKKIWTSVLSKFNVFTYAECGLEAVDQNGERFNTREDVESYLAGPNMSSIRFNIKYSFKLIKGKSNKWVDFACLAINNIDRIYNETDEELKKYLGAVNLYFKAEEVDVVGLEAILTINKTIVDKNLYFTGNFDIGACNLRNFKIRIQSNNRSGWGYAWLSLSLIEKELILKGKKVSVTLILNVTQDNDVTNLRYFLPLWQHYVKQKGVNEKIPLDLKIECEENIAFKCRQCFFALGNDKNFLVSINTGKGELSTTNPDGPSDILPFLIFEENSEGVDYCGILSQKYYSYVENFHKDTEIKGKGLRRSLAELRAELLELPVFEELNNQNENVKNFVSKLTPLVFLFFIRNAIKNSKLFLFQEGKWSINKSLVEEIWLNSKSYAEGLSQVIENALIHSKGKRAFFGMRIYKTDPNSPMSTLAQETNTREILWRKYWHNPIFNATLENTKEVLYPDFVEFYVLDDAIESDAYGYGIVNKFEEINKKSLPLGEIFRLSENDFEEDKKLSFYVEHYGLRWLHRHVDNSHGIMEVYSPYKYKVASVEDLFSMCYYSNNPVKKDIDVGDIRTLFSSEYSILIPLKYKVVKEDGVRSENGESDLFLPLKELEESKILESERGFIDISSKMFRGDTKIEKVDNLYNDKLKNVVNVSNLVCINVETALSEEIEIFAKALFHLIYDKKKDEKLYIAVVFLGGKEFAKEFARIFSVFYAKGAESKYMKDVQIAICTKSDDNAVDTKNQDKDVEINFVLAGENLKSAYYSANNFVYYNADASLEFLDLLKFLSCGSDINSDEKTLPVPLFPFDLCFESNRSVWFIKQMQQRINTDLRSDKFGCKISNVTVRLGSKIYVYDFYEAELLFHNLGIIKKFAYLIALDVIANRKEWEEMENVFLLGYENYSSLLMQEICRLLRDYAGTSVKFDWVIDSRSEDFPVLSFDKFPQQYFGKKIACITVLPIGSTMSTVYKLHASFERGCKNKTGKDLNIKYSLNYCIIAIGDYYCKLGSEAEIVNQQIESTGNMKNYKENGVFNFYIKTESSKNTPDESSIWKRIELQPSKKGQEDTFVRFLLSGQADWDESGKRSHDIDKPVLRVDKTSTILDIYFQMQLKKNVMEYYNRKSNIEKLKPTAGSKSTDPDIFFKYGHVIRGENHYQFYFDFEKIASKRRGDIIKWAKNLHKNIETDAYNIVISPLQITNSEFLKIITDYAFNSNLHLLHIKIKETGKENVRTWFSYISEEFKRIAVMYKKIKFYYIDDSICTGESIARAYKFILTLCDQTGIAIDGLFGNNIKFSKVILLVNRSSYETAQMWVNKPWEDWCGYINLFIPAYNTHYVNNHITCPGCRVRDRYELLKKRSATNYLVRHFNEHSLKHCPRYPEEFDLWQENRMLNNASYFDWFRQWIYYKDKNGSIYGEIKRFYDVRKEKWREQTLYDFLDFVKSEKKDLDVRNIINQMKFIVAEDNFIRLETMNNAYNVLLYCSELQKCYYECANADPQNFEDYTRMIRKKIINLLKDCFGKGADNSDVAKYDSVFKFISYIKVLSRDFLAKNYFVREVMMRLLKDICDLLIANQDFTYKDDDLDVIRKKVRNSDGNGEGIARINKKVISHVLQYRIYKVVTHRLALMRSDKIIDVVEQAIEAYEKIMRDEKSSEGSIEDIFLCMPSEQDIFIDFLATIKTATMEDDDDAMCFKLLKFADEQEK